MRHLFSISKSILTFQPFRGFAPSRDDSVVVASFGIRMQLPTKRLPLRLSSVHDAGYAIPVDDKGGLVRGCAGFAHNAADRTAIRVPRNLDRRPKESVFPLVAHSA